MVVTFSIFANEELVSESSAGYNVWATDYSRYALVYSCRQLVPNTIKYESAWILSRQKSLDSEIVAKLKRTLKINGINPNLLQKIDLEDC